MTVREEADDGELSDKVAHLLACVWRGHQEPRFLEYISITYSDAIAGLPRFEQFCIAEAEYGGAKSGVIGGIIKRWGLVDQDGFRWVNWREMPRLSDDMNDAEVTGRMFYRFPIIKFVREGMYVTFGEALGPELNCRKIGRLQQSAGGLSIVDVRLVWNVKSLGSDSPLLPVSPALDIA